MKAYPVKLHCANTLWQTINDQPAQTRFSQDQKRKAVTHG